MDRRRWCRLPEDVSEKPMGARPDPERTEADRDEPEEEEDGDAATDPAEPTQAPPRRVLEDALERNPAP